MLYLCMCLTFPTFEFEFIRKYNTMTILNIVDCGLCSTGTSRIEKAKYMRYGQAKYNDDGRCTCTRIKCNALAQYIIQVLCMNITKTKHNRA